MKILMNKKALSSAIVLVVALIFLTFYMLTNVEGACGGTDTFTLHLRYPNDSTMVSSAQQSINPLSGTDCSNTDTDTVNLWTNCSEAGTYDATITCDSCSVHSAPSNIDILTCYSPEADKFYIKDSDNRPVAAFDEKGYLYLLGHNYSNQASLSAPADSFVIKNDGGSIVAYITSDGDLYLDGSITMGAGTVNPPAESFIIKNNTGADVAYIDSNGNLALTGQLYHTWRDDPI